MHVGSRSTTQIRSHAQKYFAKELKKNYETNLGEMNGTNTVRTIHSSNVVSLALNGPFEYSREKPTPKKRKVSKRALNSVTEPANMDPIRKSFSGPIDNEHYAITQTTVSRHISHDMCLEDPQDKFNDNYNVNLEGANNPSKEFDMDWDLELPSAEYAPLDLQIIDNPNQNHIVHERVRVDFSDIFNT